MPTDRRLGAWFRTAIAPSAALRSGGSGAVSTWADVSPRPASPKGRRASDFQDVGARACPTPIQSFSMAGACVSARLGRRTSATLGLVLRRSLLPLSAGRPARGPGSRRLWLESVMAEATGTPRRSTSSGSSWPRPARWLG